MPGQPGTKCDEALEQSEVGGVDAAAHDVPARVRELRADRAPCGRTALRPARASRRGAASTSRSGSGPTGADQECVVFYSVRGKTDVLFELLDDNRNIVGTLTTRDFIEALEEQKKAA